MDRENNTIDYIEYTMAGFLSAISNLETAIENESLDDEITEALFKKIKNYEIMLENYITEKRS